MNGNSEANKTQQLFIDGMRASGATEKQIADLLEVRRDTMAKFTKNQKNKTVRTQKHESLYWKSTMVGGAGGLNFQPVNPRGVMPRPSPGAASGGDASGGAASGGGSGGGGSVPAEAPRMTLNQLLAQANDLTGEKPMKVMPVDTQAAFSAALAKLGVPEDQANSLLEQQQAISSAIQVDASGNVSINPTSPHASAARQLLEGSGQGPCGGCAGGNCASCGSMNAPSDGGEGQIRSEEFMQNLDGLMTSGERLRQKKLPT